MKMKTRGACRFPRYPTDSVPPERPPSVARGHPRMVRPTHAVANRAPSDRSTKLLVFLTFVAAPAPVLAGPPTDPTKRDAVIGRPVVLAVQPESVTLLGRRDGQQLMVTGRYADGSVRDLTALCEFNADASGCARVESGGWLSGTTD